MNMRVDDVHDAHAGLSTCQLVRRDVVDGVDDDALGESATAEEIRGANRRGMEELAKDHRDKCSGLGSDSSNEMIESL